MSAQHANDEEGLRMELARTREHLRTAAASSDSLQQRLEGSEKQVRELQQADCRASEHICELKAARDDLKAELKVALHAETLSILGISLALGLRWAHEYAEAGRSCCEAE